MHIPSETYDAESHRDEQDAKNEAPMEYLLTVGNVRVRLSYIGEGIFGEYDSEDELDMPLLRFDVEKFTYYNDNAYGDWEMVDNGSYCTRIHADTPWNEVVQYLLVIMDRVYFHVENDSSIKRLCEMMSDIG
jgi:hypothetical protein